MSLSLSHIGPVAAIDNLHIVKCQLCHRSLLTSAFSSHIAQCKLRHSELFAEISVPLPKHESNETITGTSHDPSLLDPIPAQSSLLMFGLGSQSGSLLDGDGDSPSPVLMATKGEVPPPTTDINASSTPTVPGVKNKKRKNPTIKGTPTDSTTTNSAHDKPPPSKKAKTGTTPSGTPKLNRKTGALNLDIQCGVFDSKKGEPCRRSITCKNHSIGQKRLVEGRSQPYDTLFELFKGNQRLQQQEANIRAAAGPTEPEELPPLPERTEDEEGAELMEAMKQLAPTCVIGSVPRWQYARPLFSVVATVRSALRSVAAKNVPLSQIHGSSGNNISFFHSSVSASDSPHPLTSLSHNLSHSHTSSLPLTASTLPV